ncbi:hypothetical protein PTTG_06092 [Puccinia triticina 1-1 BBBD Race 1]|uniref:Uncharacterized protein n=1 Tax=Puccinia triticina (isolate 1-1 / race 1 (BBBD)) TaxID=630390 RepID=A0A0C4EZ37_PUCT1|nr:hypothetical protein PTTG_06092 [Puccinia triticina 1-1 BBBD Race 1]
MIHNLLKDEATLQTLFEELDSNLDGEEPKNSERCRRRPNKDRDRYIFHDKLMAAYFNKNSTYNDCAFLQRFWLDKEVFMRILEDLKSKYPYFVQRLDCTGKLGLSPEQKMTAVLQQLGYGLPFNATDEYCRLGETTAQMNMSMFCAAIQELYRPIYLQIPTEDNLQPILSQNAKQGFLSSL